MGSKPGNKTATKAASKKPSRLDVGNKVGKDVGDIVAQPRCIHCDRELGVNEQALFVEEEVGRIFCSEKCILDHFEPDIRKLEKSYRNLSDDGELADAVRDKLAHLRWKTLENPKEIFVERTVSGDKRYTLIGEFQLGGETIWCVCISLFLRGEPSFLFLSFITRLQTSVEHYRKGDPIQVDQLRTGGRDAGHPVLGMDAPARFDGPASDWTEEETYRAGVNRERTKDDISPKEFAAYERCVNPTLEAPDEVWSAERGAIAPIREDLTDPNLRQEPTRVLHFIKHFAEGTGHWYILIARESDENEDEMEILDCFPTRDPDLVDKYRIGTKEMGSEEPLPGSRLIH